MQLRRSVLIAGTFVLAVAAGWTGYWYYAVAVARAGAEAWVEQRRAEGYRVEHGPLEMSGYPFLIRARAPTALLERADGILAWNADAVVVDVRPWNLRRYRVEVEGTQRIRAGAAPGRPFTLASDEAAAIIEIGRRGRLEAIGARIREASLTAPELAGPVTARELWLQADPAAVPPADHTQSAGTLIVQANAVRLPEAAKGPLGRDVEFVAATIQLMGRIAGPDLHRAVDAWIADGGTVEVQNVDLRWGPLDLTGSGTLAVDDDGRPLGAFAARMRGHEQLIDAFARAGTIDPQAAAFAKLGLGLVAKPTGPDGEREVRIPISAQEGRLFLGPLDLFALPPVWNRAPPG